MPLGSASEFHEWIKRDNPPYVEARLVENWIIEASEAPWSAPSVPIPEMSDQPRYEVRAAVIPGTDHVEVIYRQTYATRVIDLIWVGRRPMQGEAQ
jgi:hypothetical protein